MHTARTTVLALTAALAAACSGDSPIALTIIAPTGGDPFIGPDAATTAILRLDDNGATQPVSANVNADGSFSKDIQPASATEQARLIIEAQRGSEIVGTGATPPIAWAGVSGHSASVLMHRRDTLIPAPDTFATGRAEFILQPFNQGFVAAISVPAGASDSRVVEYYDLFANIHGAEVQSVPAEFDQETSIVPVAGEWVLVRGTEVVRYTNDPSLPVSTDIAPAPMRTTPGTFDQPLASSVVLDPTATSGGAWLVGGHDVTGARTTLVDHLQKTDAGLFAWSVPTTQLRSARTRPDVIQLQVANGSTSPLWLIVGGQAASDPVMELYSPSGVTTVQPTLGSVTPRTDTAAVCIASDAIGCTMALVLGGRDASGRPVGDDLLVDGMMARAGSAASVTVLPTPLFAHRRFGARAALAETGHVLVVGGHDAGATSDAVFDAESVDVTTPALPLPGRIVATLTNADPSVITASNGSVMIAGGRRMDGSAGTEIWFYRY